jgi:hypothetical protein
LRVCHFLAVCGLGVFTVHCGGPETAPAMSLFARPRVIHDQGATSKLTVSVVEKAPPGRGSASQPREGSVSFTAAAGAFEDGGTTATVELDGTGSGTVSYTCHKAADSRCDGRVHIEAQWSQGDEFLVQVVRVEVAPFDGGVPAGGLGDGGP